MKAIFKTKGKIMKKIFTSLVLFTSVIFAANVEVSGAYIRQTPPNAKNTAIFLTITNKSNKDITLINAQCDLSDNVELHTVVKEGNKMTMVKVPEMSIKANSSTELKPRGNHIMLFNIKKPVTKDTKVDLTLSFSNGEKLKIANIESKELSKHSH